MHNTKIVNFVGSIFTKAQIQKKFGDTNDGLNGDLKAKNFDGIFQNAPFNQKSAENVNK